eukprot:m.190627 g.190627  ORF g.190627 m.190627 type:complete len:297 (-) comp18237_c1_seq2:53-943(-)
MEVLPRDGWLETLDFIAERWSQVAMTPHHAAVCVLLSLAAFALVFQLSLRVYSRLVSPPTHQMVFLSALKQCSWTHGLCVGLCGVTVVNHPACAQDLLRGVCPWLETACMASATYFACDVYCMWCMHRDNQPTGKAATLMGFARKQWLVLTHHFVLVGVFLPLLLLVRRGHYFVGCFMCFEFSVPFLQTAFLLRHCGQAGTLVEKINGALTVFVWFVTRLCVFPFMYSTLARSLNVSFWQSLFHPRWYCHLGCLFIAIPQVYWFCLLLQKVLIGLGLMQGHVSLLPGEDRDTRKTR